MYWMVLDTPVGPIAAIASDKGLRRLDFGNGDNIAVRLAGHPAEERMPYPLEEQLREYFAGERKQFDLPLDWEGTGTPFQRRCWDALSLIPYGQVATYAEQAARVGSPRAYRAVGQANHHNPFPIVVPCHRVIASSGGLGGYGGGLEVKRQLLTLEGVRL